MVDLNFNKIETEMLNLKDIDLNEYDAVLVYQPTVNESDLSDLMGSGTPDKRATATSPWRTDKGAYSNYLFYNDPKLYTAWSFGKQLQNALVGIGSGYSAEVSDYGKYVSARITYSNPPTGRSASKTFLIVFNPDGKEGHVFSSSNRYRTFSGITQAASYIKSASSSLRERTSSN